MRATRAPRRRRLSPMPDPAAPLPPVPPVTLAALAWVCAGGATGSAARWLVSVWALRAFGPKLPWGTFAVNVLGSFAMGLFMQLGTSGDRLSPTARFAVTTGVLGGFTTYSAFSWETLRLLQD